MTRERIPAGTPVGIVGWQRPGDHVEHSVLGVMVKDFGRWAVVDTGLFPSRVEVSTATIVDRREQAQMQPTGGQVSKGEIQVGLVDAGRPFKIGQAVTVRYSDGSTWPGTVEGFEGEYVRVLDETGAVPAHFVVALSALSAA